MTLKQVPCFSIIGEDRNKKFEMNRRNWRVLIATEDLNDNIIP